MNAASVGVISYFFPCTEQICLAIKVEIKMPGYLLSKCDKLHLDQCSYYNSVELYYKYCLLHYAVT